MKGFWDLGLLPVTVGMPAIQQPFCYGSIGWSDHSACVVQTEVLDLRDQYTKTLLCRLLWACWAAQICPRSTLRMQTARPSLQARPARTAWESFSQQKGSRAPLQDPSQVIS